MGWASDERLLADYSDNNDVDICICYGYSDLSFDKTLFSEYTEIEVVGGSLGRSEERRVGQECVSEL